MLEGDSVTLVCGTDLTGNPIPTVVWRDSSDRYIEHVYAILKVYTCIYILEDYSIGNGC